MGKVLIIKGADFSANGMQAGTIVDITASCGTLTKNYDFNGAISSGNAYYNKSLNFVSPLDMSSYIAQGYTQIIATKVSADSPHLIAIKFCDANRANQIPADMTYQQGPITLTFDASRPYLLIGTRRNDGNTYGSNTYAVSAIFKIEIVKP